MYLKQKHPGKLFSVPKEAKHHKEVKDNLFYHQDNNKYREDLEMYDSSSSESEEDSDDVLSFDQVTDTKTTSNINSYKNSRQIDDDGESKFS